MTAKEFAHLSRIVFKYCPRISAQQVRLILMVVEKQGITQREIQQGFKCNPATVTSSIAGLLATKKVKQEDGSYALVPGRDILRKEVNPDNYSSKVLFLTPKGQRLADELFGKHALLSQAVASLEQQPS